MGGREEGRWKEGRARGRDVEREIGRKAGRRDGKGGRDGRGRKEGHNYIKGDINVSVSMFSLDDAMFHAGTALYKWRMWNKYDKNARRTYTIHK